MNIIKADFSYLQDRMFLNTEEVLGCCSFFPCLLHTDVRKPDSALTEVLPMRSEKSQRDYIQAVHAISMF